MKEKKPMVIGAIITVVVIAVIIFVNFAGDFSEARTVNVKGEAKVLVVPDVISVNFNVETNGSTAIEAKDANSEIVDKITLALLKKGFSEDDISTQSFNVYEDFDWTQDGSVSKGFKASHLLKIEIPTNNPEIIGDVIDSGIDNGALLQYINFELSSEKESEYKSQATLLATQDAKLQAEAMAEGLDMKLGGVVSISDANLDGIQHYRAFEAPAGGMMAEADVMMAKSSVTSIKPDEQRLYASISVVYKLKNKGFF